MSDRTFIDTNILLYSRDASEPEKQAIAESVLRKHWESRTGRISIQVLNEYFVNVTRKLKPGLAAAEAWEDVESLMVWNPVALDSALLTKGYLILQRYPLSWWDALIVAAADMADCTRILSEDLSSKQEYNGIRVVNPFAERRRVKKGRQPRKL
jgi:predicted nucleic acid-binding protein